MYRAFSVALFLCLLGADPPLRAEPIAVFVSIPPQKFLVEQIGGALVDVKVMLKPGAAPETFEPSPRQIAALNEARIYFKIGVPFERVWLDPLPKDNSGPTVIECCDQFSKASPQDIEARTDPHLWVDPMLALRIADLIRRGLSQIDPLNYRIYDANYVTLSGALTLLHHEIRAALKKRRTSYFIISHGSLGPLADAYGLVQMSLETGGRGAGPKQLADMVQRARAESIHTILVQKQFNSAAAQTLARELGAGLIEVDPLAEDYPASLRAIAGALATATR